MLAAAWFAAIVVPIPAVQVAGEPTVEVSNSRQASGVSVQQDATRLRLRWPIADREYGVLVLHKRADQPLIEQLGIAASANGSATSLLGNVDPALFLTVGIRDLSKHGWNVFFDNPPRRPHETFAGVLKRERVQVQNQGRRATVIFDGLSAGPFRGELRFTVYAGCRLVNIEAVVSTDKEDCAFLYDAGLTSAAPDWKTVAWVDTDDRLRRVAAMSQETATPVAVRQRTLVVESAGGSVAVFPPPHRYIYPLDFADNFKLVWHGRGFHGPGSGWGFGIRQPPEGDKRWVPWVNAPPRTRQHLSTFYLLSGGKAEAALEQVRRFTHGDRFPRLAGYRTFTSHYHIEHTLDFREQQRRQKTDGVPRGLEQPPFVKTFKAHGVDIVHLAEFHVAHTPELNAERLSLLRTLHSECRRLSDEHLLVLPGEEPNVYLGGHWVSLFPRPVYWLLHPPAGAPFARPVKSLGIVYAVHSAADVLRLMEQENGLMWTAHPRTKGSYGFPDRYRNEDFYKSPHFLGAAWKNMPADYSQPRLGVRALDVFSDMDNWGQRKYLVGEVDIFKVLPSHELYGHSNVTYLRLERLPRFDNSWQPVLDSLRQGRFFVSTGEVLLPEFRVAGKESGQTVRLAGAAPVEVTARLDWTFPPAFAEVIWGDGVKVHRQRVDLSDGEAFSGRALRIPVDLRGAKWVRFEAWDIAANGAISQPVWVE
jgi:hypothetical protein